jgi:hypothetical protein
MTSFLINPYRFGRLWTPADDFPDLWFNAATLSNTATWPDINSRLTLARTGTTLSLAALGNEPAVVFNNSSYFTGTYSVNNLQGLSIIWVASRSNTSSRDILCSWGGSQAFAKDIIAGGYDTGSYFGQVNNGSDVSAGAPQPASSQGMGALVFDGNLSVDRLKILFNATQTAAATTGVPTAVATDMATVLHVGEYAASLGAYQYGGSVSHLMIYRRAVSSSLMQRLEGWSAWSSGIWTLPAGHPYQSAPPTV